MIVQDKKFLGNLYIIIQIYIVKRIKRYKRI